MADGNNTALIEELRDLREPYSHSPSLGVRAALALEASEAARANLEAVIARTLDSWTHDVDCTSGDDDDRCDCWQRDLRRGISYPSASPTRE